MTSDQDLPSGPVDQELPVPTDPVVDPTAQGTDDAEGGPDDQPVLDTEQDGD